MRFHCNTTPDETIQFMRDHAVASKVSPAMIDALDSLFELLDSEGEIEKLGDEVSELEGDKDDLREELEQAADSLETAVDILAAIYDKPAEAESFFDIADLDTLRRRLKATKAAVERHGS